MGGGPAGLYTAITARLAGVRDELVVVERNPPGITHGWGVVFWDDLLDALHRTDPPSARALRDAAVVWDGQMLQVDRRAPVFLGGSGYAVGRQELLGLLTARACELDVDVRFGTPAEEVDPLLRAADVVVVADGVNSTLRAAHEDVLVPRVEPGHHPYIWLGTPRRFPTFTFGFVDTGAGWMWCHAYAFRDDRSTMIIEGPASTWSALGLDRMPVDACLRTLEELFAHLLGSEPLLLVPDRAGDPRPDRPAPWTRFQRVDLRRWHDGKHVLVGDAAHTTHFTIGSGTSLALGDAQALGLRLAGDEPLEQAFAAYEAERRAVLAPLRDEADRSTAWFADLVASSPSTPAGPADRPGDAVDDLHLAWSLWGRRSDAPTWRWYLLRATQRPALRRLRRGASTVRRGLRARRRELAAGG
ncbi:FAD-dependent monooxygenase [Actinomycetospora sp. C-140]